MGFAGVAAGLARIVGWDLQSEPVAWTLTGGALVALPLYIYANFERWRPWVTLFRDRERFHALIPDIQRMAELEAGFDGAASQELMNSWALVSGQLHQLGIEKLPTGPLGWGQMVYCAGRKDIRRARQIDFPSLDA